jgi:membrane protein implicated in regulation of membrane protease activity
MTILSIFGWLGNVAFLLGALLLAKKSILGWHCQVAGNACYVVFAILMGFEGISLFALSVLLIVINYYGLKKWSNKKDEWIWVGKLPKEKQ